MENPTTALLFSGGRNSLVLLHILEPYLDETLVIWCNTGAVYESTRKQMDQIRNTVPHFHEIISDQPGNIAAYGYPADIVPIRHTLRGKGDLAPLIQSIDACCGANILAPIERTISEKGIRQCYSGKCATAQSTIEVNGVEFKFPLAKWTNQMVLDYVKKHNIMVPPYYSQGEEKSRDCWNCTGYLWQRRAAIAALPFYQKEEVICRLEQIEKAVFEEMGWLQGITKGV